MPEVSDVPASAGFLFAVLIAFHKPYGVLSQFTPDCPGQRTLAEFGFPANVYPIGRLDLDSEGLLLLSDEAWYNKRLLHPDARHERTYLAQVEGVASEEMLDRLRKGGVPIKGHRTLPCEARLLAQAADLPPRDPPVRFRKSVPTSWIELKLVEGKNRQVRRMTAAIGLPTLRLFRHAIGELTLGELGIGQWRELSFGEVRQLRASLAK